MDSEFTNDFEEEAPSKVDPKVLLLYGIARSRFIVGLFILLGAGVGLIAGATKPNTYTSKASLRLISGQRERMTDEAAAGGEEEKRGSLPQRDEVLMLEQDEIYEKAAKQIGPSDVLQPSDPAKYDTDKTSAPLKVLHSLQSKLFASQSAHECSAEGCQRCVIGARRLLKNNTLLEPERFSTIISVTHSATSPTKAQGQLQVLLDLYVQRHIEEYDISEKYDTSKEKRQQAYDDFEDFRDAYSEHREGCGNLPLDAHEQEKVQGLIDEREHDLEEAKTEKARIQGVRAALSKKLAVMDREIDDVKPQVMQANPFWSGLNERILDLRMERLETESGNMGSDVLPKALKQIDDKIEKLTKQRDILDVFVVSTPEVVHRVPNPLYVEALGRLGESEELLAGIIEKIKGNQEGIKRLKARLESVKGCEVPHEAFERGIAEREEALRTFSETKTKLEILSGVEGGNLTIFQKPTLPTKKDGPKRMKFLLMGLAGGIFLGIAIAVLRQLLDRRVRYPETVERALGLRVIGVLPEVRSLKKLART